MPTTHNDRPVYKAYRRVACPRCGYTHDTQVCGFCGRDREDTLATTEESNDE